MQLVVVSYDVNTQSEGGQKRLRKVAKLCESCGQRVQFSVFDGKHWKSHVEHCGAKEPYDPQGLLMR